MKGRTDSYFSYCHKEREREFLKLHFEKRKYGKRISEE